MAMPGICKDGPALNTGDTFTSDRKTCAEVFEQAGCEIPAAPGCSALCGWPS